MTTSHLRVAVALSLVTVALSACGSDGPSGPSFADSVSTVNAQGMASGAASAATQVMNNINFGGPDYGLAAEMSARLLSRPQSSAGRPAPRHLRPLDPSRLDWRTAIRNAPAGLQAAMDANCTYSGSGLDGFDQYQPTDENGNEIADNMLYEFNCTEPGEGAAVNTWGLRVTIKENGSSLFGFTLRYKYYNNWDSGGANFERETYLQSADVDLRAGAATSAHAFSYTYASRFDGVNDGYGDGESWSADFDPASAIALGSPLPSGDLTISGQRFEYESGSESGDASVRFEVSTPTALHFDAACLLSDDFSPFDAGVLRGKLNGSGSQASFDVTFTGCTTYTTSIDGAYDEPIAVVSRR